MNDPYDQAEPTRKPREIIVNVPLGDHPITAEHLANKTVALITAALSEVVEVVAVHEDMAPRTAAYVLELGSTLADTTIAWMKQWPK
ncbi:hypothetical protein [Nocardia brasiliensis]|uniref:hypothetical protein n=1 Tax=Nocardia brasiliensis TaxID=37326 RepID=UPI0024575D22|nr:hypothetical protein [Nocardia brasiliensis]